MLCIPSADMVTSALVLTLTSEVAECGTVVAALAGDLRVAIGDRIATRLPVVVQSSGLGAAEQIVEWMRSLEGVLAIDVVLVDFDPDVDIDTAIKLGKRARDTSEENHGEA